MENSQPTPINTPNQTARPQAYPGKKIGLAGFIISFITNPLGLILSIVGYVQSKRAGYKNPLALAGIIIGSVFMVLAVIVMSFAMVILFNKSSSLFEQCEELGPGTHISGTKTVTCN